MNDTVPPLVSPGPPLTPDEVERYSRHLLLPDLGDLGQRRLRNAAVAVVGAGGLGSPVLMYLAAAGVGTLGIIDFDAVDLSNLQRQTIHGTADVGSRKVDSAAAAIADVNPQVRVTPHHIRLTAGNALDVLTGYDLVVDGSDNFATRYLVNDACVLLGIPYVWGSVFRFEGQVSVFWAAHGPQYRDLHPVPPPPGSVPSCGEGGVLGAVCAVVGGAMAVEAVKLICGIGRPLIGTLLLYDALTAGFRTLRVRADPATAPITALVDYEAFCGIPELPIDDSNAITVEELAALLAAGRSATVIDVREPAEFALGAVPGAVSIPLTEFSSGVAMSVVQHALATGPVVLYCKSGVRSAHALAALRAARVEGTVQLRGGIQAWAAGGDASFVRY